jgi:hypothetical protein
MAEANSGGSGDPREPLDGRDPPPTAPPEEFLQKPYRYSLGMLAQTFEDCTGKNIKLYLTKFEQRCDLEGITWEEAAKIIRFKCTGAAHEFLNSDPAFDNLTYSDIRKLLVDKFGKIYLPGERAINLAKCYMRNEETVSDFVTRLKTLGQNVLLEDLRNCQLEEQAGIRRKNEDLILSQFKIGLRKDLMKEVGILLLREENLTLSRAEELVRTTEINRRMLDNKGPQTRISNINSKPCCYICGKIGHFEKTCWYKEKRDTECNICHRKGHQGNACYFRNQRNSINDAHSLGRQSPNSRQYYSGNRDQQNRYHWQNNRNFNNFQNNYRGQRDNNYKDGRINNNYGNNWNNRRNYEKNNSYGNGRKNNSYNNNNEYRRNTNYNSPREEKERKGYFRYNSQNNNNKYEDRSKNGHEFREEDVENDSYQNYYRRRNSYEDGEPGWRRRNFGNNNYENNYERRNSYDRGDKYMENEQNYRGEQSNDKNGKNYRGRSPSPKNVRKPDRANGYGTGAVPKQKIQFKDDDKHLN